MSNINLAPEQVFLPDTEVAKMLNCSVQSLRNSRSKGVGLPYVKFGRLVRYRLSSVLENLEQRNVTPGGG
jgi:Helix-turn-helix domain